MRSFRLLGCCTILLGACSPSSTNTGAAGTTSASSATTSGSGGSGGASSSATTTGTTGSTGGASSSSSATSGTGSTGGASSSTGPSTTSASSGSGGQGGGDAGATTDDIQDNRDRLLETYYQYLKANATQPQSNGLSGSNVSSVCDLWSKLDPSPRDVFLTLTARLQGSILGKDGTSMLSHVTKIYRIAGGQGETPQSPGTCGGGEYNRMIMSMDMELQAVQLAADQDQGAVQANGKYDIADIPSTSYWRNSHDLGGPHAPFDLSDETNQGAPRGQTQYFSNPASALANMPLNRMDLTTLVDPYALEMDQDYDCVHNSNPDCSYTTYGPLCLPEANELATVIYTMSYGSYDPGYVPAGCTP